MAMFNFSDLIQQYGLPAVLVAYLVVSGIAGWRSRLATNDKINLQKQELENQKQLQAAQKIEHDAALAKQRLDMEAEAERRHTRTQNEIKRLYESRLDDARQKITTLESQRVVDKTAVEDLRGRLERMLTDLNEQKLLLQAEKRAYVELENVNVALLRNNEQLVKREQELMAANTKLKNENIELLRRLDRFEADLVKSNQRISDMEQNNSHKDAQIMDLMNKVEQLKQVTITGEMPVTSLPNGTTLEIVSQPPPPTS